MENVPKLSEMEKSKIPGYIWDYYKWPIIISIVAIIALVTFIHGRLTAKEQVMTILAGNCYSLNTEVDPETTLDGFLIRQGFDPKSQMIGVNTNVSYTEGSSNVYTLPTLTTLIGAQELDVALTHGDLYDYMSLNGEFYPLDELFTAEELEKYKNVLVTGEYQQITYNEDGSEGETTLHEYICGVKIPADNTWLASTGLYPDTDVVASVILNTKNPELAKAFLIYLLENL